MNISKRNIKAPILGIRRHRLLRDGSGVRTLIGFYRCPLSCKYCLNPECHDIPDKAYFRSVQDLLADVKVDNLYFIASGGGITFGGGEPLLYADFIADFIKEAPIHWNYSCETSLNVETNKLKKVINLIDEFIVDIKDMSSRIYQEYTATNNSNVLFNMKLICRMNLFDKVKVRVPLIPGYNSDDDITKSKRILNSMGFSRFEDLTYVTDIYHEKSEENERLYNGMNWGKITCEVLKRIRTTVARHHNIPFNACSCPEKVCLRGSCLACEQELKSLTEIINSTFASKGS